MVALAFFLVALVSWRVDAQPRAIILGFDGADPAVTAQMMDRGELPNLTKLRDSGDFQPLGSSNPPQSPTAWSSFATCKGPLNHGIYDFLRRTPANYAPGVGFGRTEAAQLGPDGKLLTPPRYVSNRKGDSFWKFASDQGKRIKALTVPFAYPAEDLGDECRQLCGLDVPDIRGTQSTYFAISDKFTKEEPVAGGMRLPIAFTGDTATVQVPGLRKPGSRDMVRVPLGITVDRTAKKLTLEIQGKSAEIAEGDWSGWLEWRFELSPSYSVDAVSRFQAMQVGAEVRLYMTCLQFHPRNPMIPISSPNAYAGELADRYGLYKTIGWEFDTKALQQGDMTEEMFLEDAHRTLEWTQRLTLDEIDAGNFDLLVAATTSTDRIGHMFWGYRDPKHPLYTPELAKKYGSAVDDIYKKMDTFVGEVMQRLQPEDLLIIMSDHGFHSFRQEFSVNTWLARHGYLTVKDQTDATSAFSDKRFLEGIDWGKTKAYGLGLGMIFLNLQGREGQGTVAPAEKEALIEEIKTKLLAEVGPDGEKVFSAVYTNVDPKGLAVADCPEFQLGYAEGYQTSKASAAGAVPRNLYAPNTDKWSGEHASSDLAITPGIFYSNKKFAAKPTLVDLGPTALVHIGLTPPADYEGSALK